MEMDKTTHEFHKLSVSFEKNLFEELRTSVEFQNLGKGRVGNHLVNVIEDGIPIVRTTSKYDISAYDFSILHSMVIEKIIEAIKLNNLDLELPIDFNNALIEVYDGSYTKMKYHSDQCLDLESESYIVLFTCYEHPDELQHNLRKLKIKDKITDEEFEIQLEHNSIVLFSMATNRKYLHKIVLEAVRGQKPSKIDNRWLGITFRKSKTIIKFKGNQPVFSNGEPLSLADEDQTRAFYKLRGEENGNMNFVYPKIEYTLSIGDTLIPRSVNTTKSYE